MAAIIEYVQGIKTIKEIHNVSERGAEHEKQRIRNNGGTDIKVRYVDERYMNIGE